MRIVARSGCRAVVMCGTFVIFGGATRSLGAQEAQDISRSDVLLFDQFLDAHADIDAQLRANPSLLTNAEYLEAHPQLEDFLNQHPQVQTQLRENSSYFMQREKRFDAHEARRRSPGDADVTRREVGAMDEFLDKNQNIDWDLRRNPALVSNAEYLEAHPQFQTFLSQHPDLKEEITENPRYFMQRENRFEAQESERRPTNPARANPNPNPDLNRQELASMDQFLDKNPSIERDLWRNPSMISNAQYLQAHPELQAFLNQHPDVKEEIGENPRYFMQRENRYETQEPAQHRNPGNPNPDLNRREIATMDQFLDRNHNIDRDLRRSPGLVNNAEYLEAHPQLQSFLNQHPGVKEEIAENPRYFMQRENQFETQGSPKRDVDRDADARTDRDTNHDRDFDRRSNPNPDLNKQELSTMDDFLDRHQDVAKSLEKRPNLINDRGYLKRHKDLDEFLSEHPAVREEVRENPTYFMNRENQYEARNMDRDVPDRDRARDTDRDRAADSGRGRSGRDLDADLNKKELQDMDRFLDKHKKIERDLQKNPSLVNDHDYMRHHKSLESFLYKNPKVDQEIRENPSAFMRSQERLEARNHRMNQPAVKPKTKIEQKEQMNTATPH